jgi:hypothetical protein
MHPPPAAQLLALAATFAAALAAVSARWRDLGALPLCLAAAALVMEPSLVAAVLPAPALVLVGVVRGASRGVSRPELTSLALLVGGLGAAGAVALPAAVRPSIAVVVVLGGVVLAGLAMVRRSSVRVRPAFVGDVHVEGPARAGEPR